MSRQLIECVPNISEGRDLEKINTISNVVETVEGVKLLNTIQDVYLCEDVIVA